MNTEISLFSKKSFIEVSKKFVCVRLGSYESKKHQDMVRDLLRGSFANTAFVVYAPDGKKKLSASGRSPNRAFGDVEGSLEKIAAKYKATGSATNATLTDFHSFKQSLNVSSADQRLLVLTVAPKSSIAHTNAKVKKMFNDEQITGRFFYDTAGKEDATWAENIKGVNQQTGIFIIRSGKYGTDGKVMKQLSLKASTEELKSALLAANAEYAKSEKRKVYNEHVSDGRKDGVDYRNTMPPGEDRDGDGKIDPKPERRGEGRPERRGRGRKGL